MDLQETGGWTALRLAANQGYSDIVKVLLEYGAHVDSEYQAGGTPLMSTTASGHTETVVFFLQTGAAVNKQKKDGRTSLEIAACYGHLDIVIALVDHGAIVDLADNDGWTPLMSASALGRKGIVSVLLQRGAYFPSALSIAVSSGHCGAAYALSEGFASLHAPKNYDGVALMQAILEGDPGILEEQLQHAGACINAKPEEAGGLSPLTMAVCFGQTDAVVQLCQRVGLYRHRRTTIGTWSGFGLTGRRRRHDCDAHRCRWPP